MNIALSARATWRAEEPDHENRGAPDTLIEANRDAERRGNGVYRAEPFC
jgi:hypothetical protein